MSTLKVGNINSLTASTPPVINDNSGTQVGTFCRAWVNFNGTGTVAIRASFNVSSITDNGTGDYTINFTTALADANYSIVATSGRNPITGPAGDVGLYQAAPTASAVRLGTTNGAGFGEDHLYVCMAVFR